MSYNILCFCGGGIRGLASVTMLNHLHGKYPNIVTGASMLAGTSTGAGITAALAKGKEPSSLIHMFRHSERNFFRDLTFNPAKDPSQPQYSVEKFYFDNKLEYQDHTLNDFKTKYGFDLLMTSFYIGDHLLQKPWKPVLFGTSPHLGNGDTKVADAVVASGSMQGMFGAHGIDTDGVKSYYVDGAYVNHDPTLAAIGVAMQSGVSLGEINVLCFGTGLMPSSLGPQAAPWGPEKWQQLPKVNEYNLKTLLVNGYPSPVLSTSLNGTSTSLIPEIAQMMLGEGHYAYLNPPLDRFIPENETDELVLDYLQVRSLDSKVVDYAAAEAVLANWAARASASS